MERSFFDKASEICLLVLAVSCAASFGSPFSWRSNRFVTLNGIAGGMPQIESEGSLCYLVFERRKNFLPVLNLSKRYRRNTTGK